MALTVGISDRATPADVEPLEVMTAKARDELNGVAVSEFTLPNSADPMPQLGQVVTWQVDDETAWHSIIRRRRTVTRSEREEVAEVTTFYCPSVLSLLSESVIYPSRGPDVLPVEVDRFFAWVSPEYDESTYPVSWTSAVEIAKQSDNTPYWTGWPLANRGDEWEDTDAYWIGSSTGDATDAPLGVSYFRRTFNVTVGGQYVVQFCGYYYGDLWIDSSHIASTGDQLGMLQQEVVDLTAGDHTFAIALANVDNGGDNPAGVIMALYPLMPDGSLGTAVMHTDDQWSMLAWPSDGQPGMTTGEVLEAVIAECQGRGHLPWLTWDFDAQLDSNGNPWIGTDHPDVQAGTLFDCSTKVGTDVLTFLQELSAAYIDFWVDVQGSQIVLHVVNKGTRGAASGIVLTMPTDPDDPATGNLVRLEAIEERPIVNDVLVAWAGGFHRVPYPASIAAHGPLGRFLSLGAQQSIVTVEALARAEMAEFGWEQAEYDASHRELGPGVPYRPGDTLDIRIPGQVAPVAARVATVSFDQDEAGVLTFTPTLELL